MLLKLKPNVKDILLVSSFESVNSKRGTQFIQNFCKDKGIHVSLEHLTQEHAQQQLSPQVQKSDAVLVPRNQATSQHIELLAALCNHYHTPLITSDSETIPFNPAIYVGPDSTTIGIDAAHKLIPILQVRKDPTSIPITKTNYDTIVHINKQAALRQGINLEKLSLLDV